MKIIGYKAGLPRAVFGGALLAVVVLSSCGSNGGPVLGGPLKTGTITTHITDPPTCLAPNGPLSNVFVTIVKVRANTAANADPAASDWVDLVDLSNGPRQIDLLALSSMVCVLTSLGSSAGVPPGNYQQLRLILLNNTPAAGAAVPAVNLCAPAGFNCVVTPNGASHLINLTSESDIGIKIPVEQIFGGGLNLAVNQAADLDLDFDACASLVAQGNGQFHFKPVLHASTISLSGNFISGTVVDNGQPAKIIPSAIILVEQADASGIDRVVASTVTTVNGTFILCPLPAGKYDLAVVAQKVVGTVTTTFGATVLFGVPAGTKVGNLPVIPEAATSAAGSFPGAIAGQAVTTGTSTSATSADVTISVIQQVTPLGGTTAQVTIPVFGLGGQPPTFNTRTGTGCSPGTACANFTLAVPGVNPSAGTFSATGTAFSNPANGNVIYAVSAESLTCSPPVLSAANISVAPGATTPASVSFTGCQ